MTQSFLESTKKKSGDRSSKSVVFQDTPSTLKSKPTTSTTKLKGTEFSNKGTSIKPGVPEESTVISATSSEGTSTKPEVLDEETNITKEKVILEWGDEQDSKQSDDDNDDIEKDNKDGDADDKGDDHEEAEETPEVKDDTMNTEPPPSSSSLSVSSDTDISSLLDIPIQQETPQNQSSSVQKVPYQ
nr:hypothetical protein [Tanacetum cinerariifolium]